MKVHPRGLLAAILAASALRLASAQPASLPLDVGDCTAQSIAGAQVPARRDRFVPGGQERYQITFRSDAKYDFSVLLQEQAHGTAKRTAAPSALAQDIRVLLSAGIELTAIDRVGSLHRVMFRFIKPDVQIYSRGRKEEPLSVTVSKDLQGPVFADMESTGRIAGLSVQQGSHNMTQGLVRTVLALSQFVVPEQGDLSSAWATEEDDPNGVFPVRYVALSPAAKKEAAVASFRKTRHGQTTTQEAGINSHAVTLAKEFVPTGSMLIRYDSARGRVLSVAGAESITSLMNHKQVGQSRNELRLAHKASGCVAARERASLVAADTVEATWRTARLALSASIQSAADDDRMIARSTLGEDTLQTLLSLLRRVSAGERGAIDDTGLYLKFKALASLKPESCVPIAEHLLTLSPTDRGYRLVVGALSVVGHEQAQAALLRLLEQAKDNQAALVNLLIALATIDRPAPDTLALFERYATQTEQAQAAATAQLGLGVIARKLWTYDRAKSDSLVQYFVSQLDASTDVSAQLQWLSVLGNGGTPAEFEPVARRLADPNPAVRSMAISALRWQADPRVGGMLVNALRDDPDENARSSAARTLEFRKIRPADFTALKGALERDPSARLRNLVLVILWQLRVEHPEVIALATKTANSDSEESVRNAATELLKSTTSTPAKPVPVAGARQSQGTHKH